MLRGTVEAWDPGAGFGLVSSADLPGAVALEASALRGRDRGLRVGDEVLFDYVSIADADVRFRAVWARTRPVAVG